MSQHFLPAHLSRFVKSTPLLALALAASTSTAFASTIVTNGGGSVTPTAGTTGAVTVANTVSTVTGTITGTPPTFPPGLVSTFTANYTETVFHDSLNPFGAGDLTFEMTFTNLASSHDSIETATNGYLAGFAGFSTDVGFMGTGTAPIGASEAGGVVNFSFAGTDAIMPGSSSDTFFIQTNAITDQVGVFSLIDSETGTSEGFIPLAAAPPITSTPEPSSLILLGTGLVGIAGMARRRFRR